MELDLIAAEGRERPISGKAEMELQDGRNKFNKYIKSVCKRITERVTVETNNESYSDDSSNRVSRYF